MLQTLQSELLSLLGNIADYTFLHEQVWQHFVLLRRKEPLDCRLCPQNLTKVKANVKRHEGTRKKCISLNMAQLPDSFTRRSPNKLIRNN
jgi:hypothetical protein